MHARRFARLAVLVIPAGVAVADDAPPAAPAAPAWPVTFATEPVSNDPNPPERLRAVQESEPLDLVEAAPAGVTAPPETGRVLYALAGPASKRVALAILRGEGDAATVFVDANGDGKFDAPGERYAVTGAAATSGQRRMATTWKVPAAKTAGAEILLSFTETLPRWSGALAPPATDGTGNQPAPALKLEFSDAAPAGAKPPAEFPKPALWGTGEYQAKNVVVAVAREADGTLRAALGAAAAPDLSAVKPASAKAVELRQGKVRTGSRWMIEGFEGAGPGVRGNLTVVETIATLTGRMNAAYTRRGSATVGGVQWVLMLVDGEYDGRFDSGKDLWWVGPANQFRSANYSNMFEGDQPFRALAKDGTWEAYRLASVDPAGAAVVAPEPAPGPLSAYLERRAERVNEGRWFPLFRSERDSFLAARGIDAKRPLAEKPAHFRYAADFEEAKALAAKEGKPLLVDFEADWCVWCKRLDFYSYPDAAVVERLAKFTCVKISNDFDARGTLKRLSATYGASWSGLPAVGVFLADGAPVRFADERPQAPTDPKGAPADPKGKAPPAPPELDHIAGFLSPAELVVALDAALAAWQSGARAVPAAPPPKPAPAKGAEPAAPGPMK